MAFRKKICNGVIAYAVHEAFDLRPRGNTASVINLIINVMGVVPPREQPNSQRPRVDRFVAPRDAITNVRRRRNRCDSCDQEDVDIWFTRYLQRKKYTNYLDEAFGLEPLVVHEAKLPAGLERVRTWPCVPRKKSYLSSADSILDLPTYSDAAYPELLDWSNDNILVAALGSKYHKWSWRTQSLISQGLTKHRIHCCKFDPLGKLLVLGTDFQTIEVHDNKRSKQVAEMRCQCQIGGTICSITALDWSPTGNSFITGCSQGMVISFSRNSKLIGWREVERIDAIIVVRVSPDARYVAVATISSPCVYLLSWPKLVMYSSVESDCWTIRTITWHPWRSALMCIGAVTTDGRARIALWDAPSSKTRQTTIGHTRNHLDAMLFSHKTGELVLSLWNTDRPSVNPRACSQLIVMSDPDTVVDRWGEGRSGLDRVRTMVFSPDGTKLATATADEDLIIWNFLPEDKKKKKKNKRFSALPVFLDETTFGYSMR